MISMIWQLRGKVAGKWKTIAYIRAKGELPDWLPELLNHLFNDYEEIKIVKAGKAARINFYISKLIWYILSLIGD